MKVHRAILAGTATTQFGTLVLISSHETRPLGFVLGMLSGSVLLLTALGVYPAARNRSGTTS
jgi:hypothetical protein